MTHGLKVKHSVGYLPLCCSMFPCKASVMLWATGILGIEGYSCWDFGTRPVVGGDWGSCGLFGASF
jgi:hypothetical protein